MSLKLKGLTRQVEIVISLALAARRSIACCSMPCPLRCRDGRARFNSINLTCCLCRRNLVPTSSSSRSFTDSYAPRRRVSHLFFGPSAAHTTRCRACDDHVDRRRTNSILVSGPRPDVLPQQHDGRCAHHGQIWLLDVMTHRTWPKVKRFGSYHQRRRLLGHMQQMHYT